MKRLSLFIMLFALCAVPYNVLADIAPPLNPPGSNLQPGAEITQVRMMAETVLIDVKDDSTPSSQGIAVVTADFTMRNLGSVDESMAVRFPISSTDYHDDFPRLTGLVVTVGGGQVSTRNKDYPDPRNSESSVPWAEFDVSFPSGRDVQIRVRYELRGSGFFPYTGYFYILATGAGWKDTIGSADIVLRMPYPVNPQNVVLGTRIHGAETTPGGIIDGNEMRWHYEDFEPGPGSPVQVMEFAMVTPAAWHAVVLERENVAMHPNDSDAWGRLGMALKDVYFAPKVERTDPAADEIYALSVQAYEGCVELRPKDAQWHAGFADLLTRHAAMHRLEWHIASSPINTELYRGLEEIRTALEQAPEDPQVLEIADRIHWILGEGGMPKRNGGYVIAWLTQTPTPDAAWLATETQAAVQSAPTETPAITPVPAAPARGCGSLALVPVAIAVWVLRRRVR